MYNNIYGNVVCLLFMFLSYLLLAFAIILCYCFLCQVDKSMSLMYVHTRQDVSHVLYIAVK